MATHNNTHTHANTNTDTNAQKHEHTREHWAHACANAQSRNHTHTRTHATAHAMDILGIIEGRHTHTHTPHNAYPAGSFLICATAVPFSGAVGGPGEAHRTGTSAAFWRGRRSARVLILDELYPGLGVDSLWRTTVLWCTVCNMYPLNSGCVALVWVIHGEWVHPVTNCPAYNVLGGQSLRSYSGLTCNRKVASAILGSL